MRTVIYTAIFGRRETRLYEPRVVSPGAEYVCFTDDPNLHSRTWDIIRERPRFKASPCLSAKWYKVLAHKALAADRSIWLDANFEILADPLPLFDEFSQDLGLSPFPGRSCIYGEAKIVSRRRYDDPDRIAAQVAMYRGEGHPENWGLFNGGILFRRHTAAMEELDSAWWREITTHSTRDQLSLPYLLWSRRAPHHRFRSRCSLPWPLTIKFNGVPCLALHRHSGERIG